MHLLPPIHFTQYFKLPITVLYIHVHVHLKCLCVPSYTYIYVHIIFLFCSLRHLCLVLQECHQTPTRVLALKRGNKTEVEKTGKINGHPGGTDTVRVTGDAADPGPEVGKKEREHHGTAGHGLGQVKDQKLAGKDNGRRNLQLLLYLRCVGSIMCQCDEHVKVM